MTIPLSHAAAAALSPNALSRVILLSLALTIALFFATHSARVLSVRNIDSGLFLSLSLSVSDFRLF